MTDNEVTEAFFKARRFYKDEGSDLWRHPNGDSFRMTLYLPNILESFSAFREHVLGVMEGEGFWLIVSAVTVVWAPKLADSRFHEPINENHLRAAVVAATRYFEGKKDEEGS